MPFLSGFRRPSVDPAARRVARRLVRGAVVGFGALLILLGVLIAPLPGPFGLPIAVVGLMIVLRNSYWAKRRFVRLHRRHPRTVRPLRRLLRPGAPVASVLWGQVLKTERLVLPRRLRTLKQVRSRVRGRPSGVRAR